MTVDKDNVPFSITPFLLWCWLHDGHLHLL